MRSADHPHREHGFTILELMTTVAIVAVLGTSLFGLARRAYADESRLTADHRALHDLRSTLTTIERDLRTALTCETDGSQLTLSRFDGEQIVWQLDDGWLFRNDTGFLDSLADFHAERDGRLVQVQLDLAGRQSGRSGTRVTTAVRLRAGEMVR